MIIRHLFYKTIERLSRTLVCCLGMKGYGHQSSMHEGHDGVVQETAQEILNFPILACECLNYSFSPFFHLQSPPLESSLLVSICIYMIVAKKTSSKCNLETIFPHTMVYVTVNLCLPVIYTRVGIG